MSLAHMNVRHKKIMLGLLIFPAGVFWFAVCLLGLSIFGHGAFRDLTSFLIALLPVVGILCLVTAYFAIIKFPVIGKFSVVMTLLGLISLIFGAGIGLFEEIWFVIFGISIGLGGLLYLREYVREI